LRVKITTWDPPVLPSSMPWEVRKTAVPGGRGS
jgi:hypothetical protein